MGKKKKHDQYDDRPAVDFSNPDEVRKYFSDLVGDDEVVEEDQQEPDTTTYVARKRGWITDDRGMGYSNDTATYRGITALAATETSGGAKPSDRPNTQNTPKEQSASKRPPVNMDIVHSYPAAPMTSEKPASRKLLNGSGPEFRVAVISHPYGDMGKGLSVGYLPTPSYYEFSPLSIIVPLYDASNDDVGDYFDDIATKADPSPDEIKRIIGDIALLMILRGIPTAVYPNDPAGMSDLSEVVHPGDMKDIILVANGAQIQVYYVSIRAVDQFVERMLEIIDNEIPFMANEYKLIFDLINMVASTTCQDIPYTEACNAMNEAFEDMLDVIHERNGDMGTAGVVDISSALSDGLAAVDMILNDIYDTIGKEPFAEVNEDSDDYEDEGYDESGDFDPYTEDDDADEVGGASNDNAPFPSTPPTADAVEPVHSTTEAGQNGNPDAEDASVTSYRVYRDAPGDGGQRTHDTSQCTTNVGEILKSQGIIGYDNGSSAGDSGTGGRSASPVRKETEEEELGRGSSGAQQQTQTKEAEKAQKEVASDPLTIQVKTVGRV